MSFLEQLEKFEEQPLSQITFNMVKWFDFEEVITTNKIRSDVESGMWIQIQIEYKNKMIFVDGQRIDIVKKRLIDFLRKHIAAIRKPVIDEDKICNSCGSPLYEDGIFLKCKGCNH